jgi:heme exporter protein CcmD
MSWADFIDMGGRGAFVWSAFGAFFLAIAAELILLRVRSKRVHEELTDHRLANTIRKRK